MFQPDLQHIAKDGFRLRGTTMSRVDGFSDVVFGFALTLLVVSLEVPKTYAELHETLRGFVPFAVSFIFLVMVWFAHFRLFRRLGLDDYGTILINAALLFVVLFFVYPLKFLANMTFGGHSNGAVFTKASQLPELMAFYGIGFAAVYYLLAALYWIGWRHRDQLEFNSLERILMKLWITDNIGVASVGVLSVGVAYLLPPEHAGLSGFTYFLIGPFKTVNGMFFGKRARLERERMAQLNAPLNDLPAPTPGITAKLQSDGSK